MAKIIIIGSGFAGLSSAATLAKEGHEVTVLEKNEQAGGRASTGKQRLLEVQPTSLHQRIPIIIGSEEDVLLVEKFIRDYDVIEVK